jgi:hypothetical protein
MLKYAASLPHQVPGWKLEAPRAIKLKTNKTVVNDPKGTEKNVLVDSPVASACR